MLALPSRQAGAVKTLGVDGAPAALALAGDSADLSLTDSADTVRPPCGPSISSILVPDPDVMSCHKADNIVPSASIAWSGPDTRRWYQVTSPVDSCQVYWLTRTQAQLAIGDMLCHPEWPVPLATRFTAQLLVLDVAVPILRGQQVGTQAKLQQNSTRRRADTLVLAELYYVC